MTDLEAWGRAVRDAESRGLSTRQACEWATKALAPVRRTKADPAAQLAHAAAVKQVRERWTDAEAAGRKAVAALSGARQREAGFRLAVKYGLL